MLKCDFNKVAKHGCSCKFAAYFRKSFYKNTYRGLLLVFVYFKKDSFP